MGPEAHCNLMIVISIGLLFFAILFKPNDGGLVTRSVFDERNEDTYLVVRAHEEWVQAGPGDPQTRAESLDPEYSPDEYNELAAIKIIKSNCNTEYLMGLKNSYNYLARETSDTPNRRYINFMTMLQLNLCIQDFEKNVELKLQEMPRESRIRASELLEGTKWLGSLQRITPVANIYSAEPDANTHSRRIRASAASYIAENKRMESSLNDFEHFAYFYKNLFYENLCYPFTSAIEELGITRNYITILQIARAHFKMERYDLWDHIDWLCYHLVDHLNQKIEDTYIHFMRNLDYRPTSFHPETLSTGPDVHWKLMAFETTRWTDAKLAKKYIHDFLVQNHMDAGAFGSDLLNILEIPPLLEKLLVFRERGYQFGMLNTILIKQLLAIGVNNDQESQCKTEEFHMRADLLDNFKAKYYNMAAYVEHYNEQLYSFCRRHLRIRANDLLSQMPSEQILKLERLKGFMNERYNFDILHCRLPVTELGVAKYLATTWKERALEVRAFKGFRERMNRDLQEICSGLVKQNQSLHLMEIVDSLGRVDDNRYLMNVVSKNTIAYVRICHSITNIGKNLARTIYDEYQQQILTDGGELPRRTGWSSWFLSGCMKSKADP